jgi:LmbE family N-acetylglucosaminyl deacetylase
VGRCFAFGAATATVAIVLPDSEVARVLVITAHPDDVDFGAAGTVARFTDAGIEVAYCIVTDGDAGGFDLNVTRPEMAAIRQREQRDAAEVVGVTDVEFLGYPDGRLVSSLELRRDISRVIRRVQPDRVLIPSPVRNFGRIFASHPDHLAAGDAALSAVYPDSRNPFAHPELLLSGFEPHTVREVWMMAGPDPDHASDITETIDRKVKALRCHVSQLPEPETMDERMRMWGSAVAQQFGLPEGRLAEAFQVFGTA